MPGVAEAYKASVPMIVLTSDIPLDAERRNMLTGVDQTALFRGITKDTITVAHGTEIPRAFRRMVLLLSVIYLVTVALLLALVPWQHVGVGESPFVTVLRTVGIPAAASVMNLVVLSAALSSANANLYLISRTLFSLARAGFVPGSLGTLSSRGAPVRALLVSSAGLAVAVLVRALWPESAYVWFFGVALFGALFVWLMIFATHVAGLEIGDGHRPCRLDQESRTVDERAIGVAAEEVRSQDLVEAPPPGRTTSCSRRPIAASIGMPVSEIGAASRPAPLSSVSAYALRVSIFRRNRSEEATTARRSVFRRPVPGSSGRAARSSCRRRSRRAASLTGSPGRARGA
jgi:hypothetical protein